MRMQRVTLNEGGQALRPNVGYHGQHADPLEILKNQLISQYLAAVRDTDLMMRLRRVADESASMAWATTYPLLTLPELLREKTAEALSQHERQLQIRSGNRPNVSLAA